MNELFVIMETHAWLSSYTRDGEEGRRPSSFRTPRSQMTSLAASVAEKSLSSDVDVSEIISQANNSVATTLGISADTIGQDYLKVKNPESLAAAAQVSSILSVVGSATGGGNSTAPLYFNREL